MRGSNKLAPLSNSRGEKSSKGAFSDNWWATSAYYRQKWKSFNLYFSISHTLSHYCRLVALNPSLNVLNFHACDQSCWCYWRDKKPLIYLVDSTLQKFMMKNMNQYETCKTASKYKKGAVSADYPFFLILL